MPVGVTPEDSRWDGNHGDAGNNDNNNNDGGDNNDNGGDNNDTTVEDKYANWQPDPNLSGTGDCINLYDQDCGDDCTSCKWTWPTGDPRTWGSPDARCRCM